MCGSLAGIWVNNMTPINLWKVITSAGLSGLPFSINLDTGEITGGDSLTEDQLETLTSIVAEYQEGTLSPATASQITDAPEDLFGGPTLGDIFSGN